MRNAKQGLAELSRPGPLAVLRGDLGMSGIPGVIYAPEEGLGLPAVAFGHDWLQPPARYADLLRHLASWGFVTAAPSSHRGPLPSHAGFAADLRNALEVCIGVRLGDGRISVDSRRTAFAGHGIGGGAALVAAAGFERVAAVVTLAPAQTHPSALEAARKLTVPVLHLAAGKDLVAPARRARRADRAVRGWPVILRTLPKASTPASSTGGTGATRCCRAPPRESPARLTRALVTAFLMRYLCDEDRVDPLVDGKIPGTVLPKER